MESIKQTKFETFFECEQESERDGAFIDIWKEEDDDVIEITVYIYASQ